MVGRIAHAYLIAGCHLAAAVVGERVPQRVTNKTHSLGPQLIALSVVGGPRRPVNESTAKNNSCLLHYDHALVSIMKHSDTFCWLSVTLVKKIKCVYGKI